MRTLMATAALAVVIVAAPAAATPPGTESCPTPDARRASAPMAIDHRLFDGTAKGMGGNGQIILSTRLSNSVWTSFFARLSAAAIRTYANDPGSIPVVAVGDVVNVSAASYVAAYRTLASLLAPGSAIVLPVVTFKGKRAGTATIDGFATVQVTAVTGRGKRRSVMGSIVSVELCP